MGGGYERRDANARDAAGNFENLFEILLRHSALRLAGHSIHLRLDLTVNLLTPTISAKRPAGITVHASMLKKRFLLRRLLSVPGCVLSSAENTAQNSIAMPARYPRLTMQVSGTVAPQLFQRNGPLESQCTQACSKSGSFCADCCLCLAACCQALTTLHRTA